MTLTPEQQFLLGGGGAPSAFTADDAVGTTRGGTIVDPPTLQQQTDFDSGEPLCWDDGKPRMQLVVTVQTDLRDPSREDDDGRRRFYVKGDLQYAVRDALKAAGAPGLEMGGSLYVTRTGRGEPKKRGAKGAWLHSARYVPAATNFMADSTPAAPAAAPQTPAAAVPSAPAAAELNPAEFPHLSPEQLAGVKAAGLTADQVRQMFPAPVDA
jgi:hypothetical protein